MELEPFALRFIPPASKNEVLYPLLPDLIMTSLLNIVRDKKVYGAMGNQNENG